MMRGLNKIQDGEKYFKTDALGDYAVEIVRCFKKCVGKDDELHDKPESFLVEVKVLEKSEDAGGGIDVGDIVSIIKKPFGRQAKFAFKEIKEFVTVAFASQDGILPNAVDFDDDRSVAVVEENTLEGVKVLVNVQLANNPQYTKLAFRPVSG